MKRVYVVLLVLFALTGSGLLFAAPININQASAQELADNLKGIGIKKAHAIVQYREKIGGFQSQKQLLNVKGIGAATIEKNQDNILLK